MTHSHDPNDLLSIPDFLCRDCHPMVTDIYADPLPVADPAPARKDPEVEAFLQEQAFKNRMKSTNSRIAKQASENIAGKVWDTRVSQWVSPTQRKEAIAVSVHTEKPETPVAAKQPEKTKERSTADVKNDILMNMLQRPEGATKTEISAQTGWLGHTAGARISGVKKTYNVTRIKEPRGTVYRVVSKKAEK